MTGRPTCLITTEPEGWILRTISESVARFGTRFNSIVHNAYHPWTGSADVVFYSSWPHFFHQPPAIRALPFVVLVTHIDRFAFRIAALGRMRRAQIVCMSERYRRHLRWYGVPAKRISVAPLGISLELFSPPPAPIEHQRTVIGIVGRLYPDGRKGEALLARVLEMLDPAQHELLVVGDRWENWIARHVHPRFTVRYERTIPANDLPERYAEMDALLIPSKREGGPVPALEALACGTPVISRPVGYVTDLIDALPFAGRIFTTPDEAVAALQTARRIKQGIRHRMEDVRAVLNEYQWERFACSIEARLSEAKASASTR